MTILCPKAQELNPLVTKKILLISGIFIFIMMISSLLTSLLNPVFSDEKIKAARKILFEAHQSEAGKYAPEILLKADNCWGTMLSKWREENNKLIFSRNYLEVDSIAIKAAYYARQSLIISEARKDSLRESVKYESAIVKELIQTVRLRFIETNLNVHLNKDLVSGELLMLESEAAYLRNDFLDAHRKINQIKDLIAQSETDMSRRLEEYFSLVPVWESWATETIQKSAKDSVIVIVVDKLKGKCTLFENGKLKVEYNVDLGLNWIGPKKYLGDKATPEGLYHVTEKKEGKNTGYYLALEIDYPNRRDRENFRLACAQGELPPGSEIGAMIELHGGGGEGENWTDGCVALKNEDMDTVFLFSEIGTPVTIVGALPVNFTGKYLNTQ